MEVRANISIALSVLLTASGARAATEPDGPIANPTSGAAIEVSPPAQPSESSRPPATPAVPVRTAPAPAVPPDLRPRTAAESKPLGTSKQPVKATGSGIAPAQSSGWSDHWSVRTIVALGAVIALMFAFRWIGVKLGRSGAAGLAGQFGAGGRAPSGVLSVLGRYPISRGHTLVLLKLDRRVLLLGQSAAGFTALSEITDPEDVASILVKTRDDEGASAAAGFSKLLRGLENDPSIIEEHQAEPGVKSPRAALRLAATRQTESLA